MQVEKIERYRLHFWGWRSDGELAWQTIILHFLILSVLEGGRTTANKIPSNPSYADYGMPQKNILHVTNAGTQSTSWTLNILNFWPYQNKCPISQKESLSYAFIYTEHIYIGE